MSTLRINGWSDHFETSESSKRKGPLKWVALPTKHDGKSYRRLMRLPNAAEIYGAWMLIVAVAGKCPIRGVLADSEGPLTVEDLEDKTGLRSDIFARAIEVLSSDRFRWLEPANLPEPAGKTADTSIGCRSLPENRPTPQDTTPQDTTIQDTTPQAPEAGGGVLQKRFRLWRNATRQQILSPSGAQRVYELATGAGICTTSERHHVFRLILSLSEATGNLPAILTSILRGDAGKDSWKSRGGDFDDQAREWQRSLDVPPEMQQRTSDLSTGPPSTSIIDDHKRKLLEFEQKRKEKT